MEKINVNFTQSDIEDMLDWVQTVDENQQEIVFEWTIDGKLVVISVGDDDVEDVCDVCGGTGEVYLPYEDENGREFDNYKPCKDC